MFQRAIRIDPDFALAHSGLSDSCILLGMYGGVRSEDMVPQAKAAALKALSLDENLAEAHGSLGQCLVEYERDWAGAEREFRRAIELNPNYASAYQWCAELLYYSGRFEEAQMQARRAVELGPLSRIINSVLARAYLFARSYEEAIVIFRKNIELNPDWYGDYEYLFYTWVGGRDSNPDKQSQSLIPPPDFAPFHRASLLTYRELATRQPVSGCVVVVPIDVVVTQPVTQARQTIVGLRSIVEMGLQQKG